MEQQTGVTQEPHRATQGRHVLGERQDKCPHCGNTLSYEENGAIYSRCISVHIFGVHDGGLFYRCPDFSKDWHRWADPRMCTLAEKYMNRSTGS